MTSKERKGLGGRKAGGEPMQKVGKNRIKKKRGRPEKIIGPGTGKGRNQTQVDNLP